MSIFSLNTNASFCRKGLFLFLFNVWLMCLSTLKQSWVKLRTSSGNSESSAQKTLLHVHLLLQKFLHFKWHSSRITLIAVALTLTRLLLSNLITAKVITKGTLLLSTVNKTSVLLALRQKPSNVNGDDQLQSSLRKTVLATSSTILKRKAALHWHKKTS